MAVINLIVYLVVAIAYLLAEVLRILINAVRQPSKSSNTGSTASGASGTAEPGMRATAAPPAVEVTDPKVQRCADPDPNQIPLFEAESFGNASPPQSEQVERTKKTVRKRSKNEPSADGPCPAPTETLPDKETSPIRERPKRMQKPAHFKERWIGTLTDYGVGKFTDAKSGRAYSSYFVSVETDDGGLITKQGVELETAIQYAGANAGDRVEVLLLGREPVEIKDGDQTVRKHRNRWRINVK